MGNPYAKFDDYGLRHLSSHLIAIEWWDELEAMLCDLRFVEAKCAAGLVDELEGDYNTTFSALPEAQLELEQARTHQQEVADYTQGLIAYARAWSKAYARHTADPARYPLSPPKAIRPPTLAMVHPWTDEEIRADTERIIHTPTRLDRLRAFATFVRSENHHLRRFANSQPGFCVQQAYNSADAGLVVRAAESLLEADTSTSMLLLHPTQRAVYTPHSALLRTIEGHTHDVTSVSVTPDGRTAVSSSDDGFVWVWDLASGTDSETLVPLTDDWYIGNVSVTLDGLTAVSGCDDSTVRVWDLTSGRLLAILPIPGGVSSLSTIATNGQLGIGTESGQVIFVRLQNVPSAPPLITARRPWLFRTSGSEGSWDRLLTAECPHCNYFLGPHGHPLIAIQQITLTAHLAQNQSPCLELSPQAWDEPRLLSQCPRCHQPLRFNPFVLDQRDQVPIVTEPERRGSRSWLISTFVWSPLIIAVLSYCLGTSPTFLHFDRSLAWAALVGLILAWIIMGLMSIREEQTTREEALAVAGVGILVTAGALTMSLAGTSQIGLLVLAEVAAGVMIGVAGGLTSGVEYPGVTMEIGLAVSVAAVGALVAGTLVAGSLGGGLPGLVVRAVAGLVTFVVGGLAVMLIAWLILKIVQRIVKLSWPVGSVGGVVIGLVAAGILVWLGQVQVGKVIFLVAVAYSVAVGIADIMQQSPKADRSPRLGWGMRIAVAASFLVLIWICLLGSWPLQAR